MSQLVPFLNFGLDDTDFDCELFADNLYDIKLTASEPENNDFKMVSQNSLLHSIRLHSSFFLYIFIVALDA